MELTRRQVQVAERVARGLPDKRIAAELHVSVYTVRSHLRRIAADLPGEAPRRTRIMLFFLNLEPDPD